MSSLGTLNPRMADERPITMSPGGLPSTVLPAADPRAEALLAEAERRDPDGGDAVAAVVAAYPRYLAAWAALGDAGADTIGRYAAYRVGYLRPRRAAGERLAGSGYVRWARPTNVGFLRCSACSGRRRRSASTTKRRCEQFLLQLDPTRPPS